MKIMEISKVAEHIEQVLRKRQFKEVFNSEVEQDRTKIKEMYQELKKKLDFESAEIIARKTWLEQYLIEIFGT